MENSSTRVGVAELGRMLEGAEPPLLVDARLEEDFKRGHLPGARSNCVLEVDFPQRMPGIAPDRAAPVCVYGAGPGSFASRMAAEKLRRAGYGRVFDFREGVAGWKQAGRPLEDSNGEPPDTPLVADGVYEIDPEMSRIRWVGRNLLNSHEGTVGIRAGSLRVEDGRLAGGTITIDMRTIRCTDLEGNPAHDVLLQHLMDLDFFDVEKHPEAVFEITGAREIEGATPGAPNLRVTGTLSLRGKSARVEFDTCAGVTPEGQLAAQAAFAIDRTLWGVIYGSGKFFGNVGGHLVNDLIELQLRIVAGGNG